MADQEIEYESDPEEGKLSLKLRRREASDDEEEEEGSPHRGKPPRRIEDSDGESEGAPAEYEDEVEEGEGEGEYDLNGEEFLEEEYSGGGRGVDVVESVGGGEAAKAVIVEEKKEVGEDGGVIDNEDSVAIAEGEHDGEGKDVEPFAVPTAGAFYMHDDRFRDNARGRNRRSLGERKLWESKDNKKWGHDKFEELTMQERYQEEPRRGSKGHYRARDRNRGAGRGYTLGNRPREYTNNNNMQSNNYQRNAPKGFKGRGPQRYQSSFKSSNEAPVALKYQSAKLMEKHSNVSSGRTTQAVSNSESDMVQPRKQIASNLSIASPPFYPTGSSTKGSTVPLKRDVQAGTINQNGPQSSAIDRFNMGRSMRGKNSADSISVDKLYIDDSALAVSGKPRTVQMSGTGPVHMNASQPQLTDQGRRLNSWAHMSNQPDASGNQANKAPPPSQPQSFRRNSAQNRPQSSVHQFTRGPQAASPPKAAGTVNAYKSGEMESASESSLSKTAVVVKGKGVVQGSGKGSFLYGGAQVVGATSSMTSGHSDQNFPAFLPVMQFGAQHPGGMGVPAVGMAFPGYVAQPQLGLGSSEMTWLPVLAGAAGPLGATYCPPYLTMDDSYNPRPSGQAPSTMTTSSKETSVAKGSNDWKPQNPELAMDDLGQRQKIPRRYTEMKFDE